VRPNDAITRLGGDQFALTAGVGIVAHAGGSADSSELIRRVDLAM
jgi:GGDEF domain-containing protein